VRRYLAFVLVGSFFSSVEEFLTVAVLRGDLASFVFTVVVVFPGFLTFVYLSFPLLARISPRRPVQELAAFGVYAVLGLGIEWFLIGLSPWSDPEADPVLMLLFQLGMFSFWATVAFAPRLFLAPGEPARRARRAILRFYVPYFAFAYLVCLAVPREARFIPTIALVVIGYSALIVFYGLYFHRAFADRVAGNPAR
jgi:hypothetical protein